jgi:DNA polymerase-3 subunit delta'
VNDVAHHARDASVLEGVEGPVRAFLEALERGRLHHAWLLTGPEGVGKASFAYQAARRLLGARPDPNGDGLASLASDPATRLVAARAHPDLLVLERLSEDNPTRKSIPVDEARRLPEFFSKAPAIAPYRVAVIDAADDLNPNAANAVLKTLEEPSGRGVLFLVSHAPGRLLPTIKSRCRRLAFAPWPDGKLADFIAARTELNGDDVQRLAQMAHGAPGRALSLMGQGALELDRQVAGILQRLPDADASELLGLAEKFRGAEGALRYQLLIDRVADRIRDAATQAADADDGLAAEPWVQAWGRLSAWPAQVEGLNLDRADAFWTMMADLRAVARMHPLPC